jgi:hypothetical protein
MNRETERAGVEAAGSGPVPGQWARSAKSGQRRDPSRCHTPPPTPSLKGRGRRVGRWCVTTPLRGGSCWLAEGGKAACNGGRCGGLTLTRIAARSDLSRSAGEVKKRRAGPVPNAVSRLVTPPRRDKIAGRATLHADLVYS